MLGRTAFIAASMPIIVTFAEQRMRLIFFSYLVDQIEDLHHWLRTAAVQWESPFDKLGYAVERN